jgi:hypothetical protein
MTNHRDKQQRPMPTHIGHGCADKPDGGQATRISELAIQTEYLIAIELR